MGEPRRRVEPFPWKVLKRPLDRAARTNVTNSLRGLLAWQERLERWKRPVELPDATPFVALYARGRLAGCFGSTEGAPGERLARAFLNALSDVRYGVVTPAERGELTACVSYLRAPVRRSHDELERCFELGTHGLAAVVAGREPALLLPSVAIDERASLPTLLEVLTRKLGVTPGDVARAPLYTFETDQIVVRSSSRRSARSADTDLAAGPRGGSGADSVELAARWLSRTVDAKGTVLFGIDARGRTKHAIGEFMHGRAAAVVQALAAHGGYPRHVARARHWLRAEVLAALSGRASPAWPENPAEAAGTVALAALAGADVARDLTELAAGEALRKNPWHAAQAVTALGPSAPPALFRAVVAALRTEPWAPWTALAAHAFGDRAVAARATEVLARSIRAAAPHAGAADITRVPEVALTALTVEALAKSPSRAARAAAARGVSFLQATQFAGDHIPASLDAEMAHGAFPLSSIVPDLRSDATAHALLALLATRWND